MRDGMSDEEGVVGVDDDGGDDDNVWASLSSSVVSSRVELEVTAVSSTPASAFASAFASSRSVKATRTKASPAIGRMGSSVVVPPIPFSSSSSSEMKSMSSERFGYIPPSCSCPGCAVFAAKEAEETLSATDSKPSARETAATSSLFAGWA